MFDSLFLLGVGGRTVYHGPGTDAKAYFENLGYRMQEGESQADWFLDISSGDIEPDGDVEADDDTIRATSSMQYRNRKSLLMSANSKPAGKEDEALAKARAAREKLYRAFDVHFENLPSQEKAELFDPPKPFPLPETPQAVSGRRQLIVQLRRNALLSWRNRGELCPSDVTFLGTYTGSLISIAQRFKDN